MSISPALARLVARHTDMRSSAPRLGAEPKPDPEFRTCPECYHRNSGRDAVHHFDEKWCCSGCGERSTIFTEFDDCSGCGLRRRTEYSYNSARVICGCGMTPEQQVALARRQADIVQMAQAKREEDELEKARARRRNLDRETAEVYTVAADKCWKQKNQRCSTPLAKQFAFCRQCQRFKKR